MFTPKNLKLAGYETNPLEDKTLDDYFTVYSIEMGKMVTLACEGLDLSSKIVDRSKNLYALGLLFWIYDRPLQPTKDWLEVKFGKNPELVEANVRSLEAGYNYGDTTEIFTTRYKVDKANLPPGKYRNVIGNNALSMGLAAAALYLSCVKNGEDKTQRDIAEAANVTEVTIRNRYKGLKESIDV